MEFRRWLQLKCNLAVTLQQIGLASISDSPQMAKKPPPAPTAKPKTELTVSGSEARSKLEDRISKGRGLRANQSRNQPNFAQLQADVTSWRKYNYELLKQLFSTQELATEYSRSVYHGPMVVSYDGRGRDELGILHRSMDGEISCLVSIVDRLELYPAPSESSGTPESFATPAIQNTDFTHVFLVHGHDDGAKESTARFLEKLGITAVILHEQPNLGKTLIEKLEHYGKVPFAVVLLTPDDEGRAKDAPTLNPRARQNVVLELGYFVGHLGRMHVCALYKGGVELPSDYDGVVWIDMDGEWRVPLARELRAAGFTVDMNLVV
jgi:predicted nucleotide-binding protein